MVALPGPGSGDRTLWRRPMEPAEPSGAMTGLSHRQIIDGIPSAVIVTDPSGIIVLWNATAEALYGWSEQEVLGRPIVDLLIPSADDDLRQRSAAVPVTTGYEDDRLLIAKDGTVLEVHVATRPLHDPTGGLAAIVGISSDVGELNEAKAALVEAGESLRATLAGETRRALLAEATSDLAVSLSVTDSLQRLARLVIPDLADWVIIDLADQNAKPHQVAMLHRDGHHEIPERFSALQPQVLTEEAPIMRVLATGEPILRRQTSTDVAGSFVSQRELLELCDRLGICSVMYVPMVARGRTLGCLTLVAGVSGRHFDEADLAFAMGLAQRAALVVDNSSLYEREHHIANVLQESLLPTLSDFPGLDIAARYRPSDTYAQVGGDFYDVLPLSDGTIALMVGDVMGHDLTAAATMGQLRGQLRACAWEAAAAGQHDPAAVLDRTDALVHGLQLTRFATVLYARAERPADGPGWELRYSTAGHPLPLLRHPDGTVIELEGRGLALGAKQGATRDSYRVPVPFGSVMVAFTDGLVERRSMEWHVGLESLRSVLADAPADTPLDTLTGQLLASVEGECSDDAAALVMRFT